MPDKLKILIIAPAASAQSEESLMAEYFLAGSHLEIEAHFLPVDFSEPSSFFQKLGKVWSFRKEFGRLKSQVRPDALLIVTRPEGTFVESAALLVARRQVPRTILHVLGTGLAERLEKLSGLTKTLFPKAFGQPDLVIVPSKDALREAGVLHAKASAVVPNGIPEAWEDGPRRERNFVPHLLFMGPLTEEKGVGVLIEACKLLRGRGLDFRCRIVGHAATPGRLEELKTQAAELEKTVTFLEPPHGDAKWDLFAESDIFCYPTFDPNESFGTGLIEAMMSGLPIAATNWRAVPEMVGEGKSGFLVAPRDPKALSDRLAKMLRDSLLCQIMGNSGRNRYLSLYGVEIFQQEMARTLLENAAALRGPSEPKGS